MKILYQNEYLKFILQLTFFSIVSFYFLTINSNALYYGYDGAYMKQLLNFHFDWSKAWSTSLTMNPLQGLANIAFPINYWYSPASVISYFINNNKYGSQIIYTFTAIQFFCSIWFLSTSLDTSRFVKISASWIGSFLIGLIFIPKLPSANFYPIAGLIPWIVESIAFSNLILGCFLLMFKSKNWACIFWQIIAVFLLILLLIAFPYASILAFPIIFIFIICLYYTNRTFFYQNNLIKISTLLSIILLIPTFTLVCELVLISVPTFFNSELIYGRPGLVFISILFHGIAGIGWISTLIYLFGLFGAYYVIKAETGKFQLVAKLYLALSIFLVLNGFVFTFIITSYRGPSMLYFEWFLYPFMFVFTMVFIERTIFKLNIRFIKFSNSKVFNKLKTFEFDFTIPSLVLFIAFLFNNPSQYKPQFWPQSHTTFTNILVNKIGLSIDNTFRGSVITFNNPLSDNASSSWQNQQKFDFQFWRTFGNDHRATGLWLFNIPTIFSYNQFMLPDYYYLVTRLFANSNDIQQRSVVVLSKPDPKLFQLFGIRFIITDNFLSFDSEINLVDTIYYPDLCYINNNCLISQYLYEISHVNFGSYSPTRYIYESNASKAINIMRDESFDPMQDFIVSNTFSGNFSSALSSSLTFEKGGFRVKAKSLDKSVLILPIQYSHCLNFENKNALNMNSVELFRVNIGLTGLKFSGEINEKILIKFGPFTNIGCRVNDYIDFKKLFKN